MSVTLQRNQVIVDHVNNVFEQPHVLPLLGAVAHWMVCPSPEPKLAFELHILAEEENALRVTMKHAAHRHRYTVHALVVLPLWPVELEKWKNEMWQKNGVLVEFETNIGHNNETQNKRRCTRA